MKWVIKLMMEKYGWSYAYCDQLISCMRVDFSEASKEEILSEACNAHNRLIARVLLPGMQCF